MTTICSIPFIKNWTISLKDIPKYADFEGDFIEQLDYHIGLLIMESGNPLLTKEMKTLFNNSVLQHMNKSNGELVVKHNNTQYKMGRYYPNQSVSMIPHSRYIKHTMFKYLGWLDMDMIKGHPTIAVKIGETLGLVFTFIKTYIENFDEVTETLIEFYSVKTEGEERLVKGDIKQLFNMMIYGGGFSTWKVKIAEEDPKYGKKAKKIRNENVRHSFVVGYKAECDVISKHIYSNNPLMVEKLRVEGETDYKTRSRVVSYWFQAIENHILYICYQFLVEKGIMTKKRCGLEFDGICIPPIDAEIDLEKLTLDINSIIYLKTGLSVRMKFKDYDENNILDDIIEKRKNLITPQEIKIQEKKDKISEKENEKQSREEERINEKQKKNEIKINEKKARDEKIASDKKIRDENNSMEQKQKMDERAIEKKHKDQEKLIEKKEKEEERAIERKQKDEDKAIEKKNIQEMKAYEKKEKDELKAIDKKEKAEKIAEEKLKIVGVEDGDDAEASRIILENYPHFKYCNQELYVFDKTTGMWSTNRAISNKAISKSADKLNIYRMTKDGKEYTGKNYANCHNKRKDVYEYIKEKTVDDDWILRSHHTSLGKILFTNGHYDFINNNFHHNNAGFNPDIVFYCRIDHAFTVFNSDDMDYMKTIQERLFYIPLGKEVGNYLILNLARGLAGDMMKRTMFGLGKSNTGKGVQTKALQLSCGQYVGTFNAENLAYNQSSNDEAQKLRWALLLQHQRIVISNEMTNSKPLNGNILKKVCSGGDTLIARLHGGLETPFVPQFLTLLLANDIPDIKPYDDAVINRVRVYSYTKPFVDEPKGDFELKKDPLLEKEMQTLRFQRCFVGMLINSYLKFNTEGRVENEPLEVMMAKKDWMGDDKENDILVKFQNKYELTNNTKDFVTSKDIELWVNITKELSYRKFAMELKKYALVNQFRHIENKLKKVKNNPIQVWFGIKKIEEVYDTDKLVFEEEEQKEEEIN